ncbi:hypothetical protein QUF80_04090 [Desulfococcaceae bacterium HSG8]|nr:hypothetical protein [Desulfococcaceae bacterium HSG8]
MPEITEFRTTVVRILSIAAFFTAMLAGCIRSPYLDDYHIQELENVEKEMTAGHTAEVEFDRKVLEAVKQMASTLKPEYRYHRLKKHKVGFLEISDIDRQTVSVLHKYVTEKTLTFSFLQPVIADNFDIVERFLLRDILRELHIERFAYSRITDQKLARKLGQIYDIDIIETGVVTESIDFIDLNLRMIETQRGRIIAVGSVKIEKTRLMRKWFEKMIETGEEKPQKLPRRYFYEDY